MMYMPLDVALGDGADDLDDRETRLGADLGPGPDVAEEVAHGCILDGLVVGHHHRDQARVRSALDVVLAAQRVKAGAGPPDLAAEQRERDQAAGVVGAVDVLGDTHAPEDHRRRAPGRRCGATSRIVVGVDAAEGAIFSGVKPPMCSAKASKPSVKPSMYWRS
jgi:hypothetical protein